MNDSWGMQKRASSSFDLVADFKYSTWKALHSYLLPNRNAEPCPLHNISHYISHVRPDIPLCTFHFSQYLQTSLQQMMAPNSNLFALIYIPTITQELLANDKWFSSDRNTWFGIANWTPVIIQRLTWSPKRNVNELLQSHGSPENKICVIEWLLTGHDIQSMGIPSDNVEYTSLKSGPPQHLSS